MNRVGRIFAGLDRIGQWVFLPPIRFILRVTGWTNWRLSLVTLTAAWVCVEGSQVADLANPRSDLVTRTLAPILVVLYLLIYLSDRRKLVLIRSAWEAQSEGRMVSLEAFHAAHRLANRRPTVSFLALLEMLLVVTPPFGFYDASAALWFAAVVLYALFMYSTFSPTPGGKSVVRRAYEKARDAAKVLVPVPTPSPVPA